jgi:NAD(P)-dependent dehydrogenase (short-subunit alcohol dehydrogenase family)
VSTIKGRRILVAGASSGIGREFAIRAIRAGAAVALSARRAERLEEVIETAGGGIAVPGDLRIAGDCQRIVRTTVDRLGGIDLLFCTVGAAPLRYFAFTTSEDWDQVLGTNVVGIHQLVRAAVPVLEPGAMVVALSTETAFDPRHALGAYAASKAALEVSFAAWRVEHGDLRFGIVEVGVTQPTEFGVAFDPDVVAGAIIEWAQRGLVQEQMMATEDVAEFLVGTVAIALRFPGIGMEHLRLRSPSAVATGAAEWIAHQAASAQTP